MEYEVCVVRYSSQDLVEHEPSFRVDLDDFAGAQQLDEVLEQRSIEELWRIQFMQQ